MKFSIITLLLIGGLLTSSLAFSQSLSLYEYYNEYMESAKISAVSEPVSRSEGNKLSLPEYYSEYCADNDTPVFNRQTKSKK